MRANGPDRRCAHRVGMHELRAVLTSNRDILASVLDLSIEGALLSMEEDDSSSVYQVRIPFGRDPEEAIQLPAVVVHKAQSHIGVRWAAAVPAELSWKLARLMERELGDLRIEYARVPMLMWPSAWITPAK